MTRVVRGVPCPRASLWQSRTPRRPSPWVLVGGTLDPNLQKSGLSLVGVVGTSSSQDRRGEGGGWRRHRKGLPFRYPVRHEPRPRARRLGTPVPSPGPAVAAFAPPPRSRTNDLGSRGQTPLSQHRGSPLQTSVGSPWWSAGAHGGPREHPRPSSRPADRAEHPQGERSTRTRSRRPTTGLGVLRPRPSTTPGPKGRRKAPAKLRAGDVQRSRNRRGSHYTRAWTRAPWPDPGPYKCVLAQRAPDQGRLRRECQTRRQRPRDF